MKVQQFLNPKSMLTPGIAGSMVMLLTNTVVIQFGLPARWTALVLSLLLALIVFVSATIPIWQRFIYYLFNALLIFSISVGTNQVGAVTTKPKYQESPEANLIASKQNDLRNLENQLVATKGTDVADAALKHKIRDLQEEIDHLMEPKQWKAWTTDQAGFHREPFFQDWFE